MWALMGQYSGSTAPCATQINTCSGGRSRGAAARCALRLSGRAAWVGDPTPGRTPRTPREPHRRPAARQEHPTANTLRSPRRAFGLGSSVLARPPAARRAVRPYLRPRCAASDPQAARPCSPSPRARSGGSASEEPAACAQRPKGSPARRARWRHPRAGPCLRTGSGRGCQEGGRARPPRCCAARSLCPSGCARAAQLASQAVCRF